MRSRDAVGGVLRALRAVVSLAALALLACACGRDDRDLLLTGTVERTLVELISTRHALRVEWYIVALIVLEILLTLYSMATG